MAEHWFDALNKVLVRGAPRRTLLGATASLVASRILSGAVAEAAKNRKKKRKRKKDRPRSPAPSCSGGACATEPEWAGDQGQIDFCELVCRQCDGDDPRQFCIAEGVKPDGTPTMVARCCDAEQECCGNQCCGPAGHCCDLGNRGKVCISPNAECCPDDTGRGYCSPDQDCCPGYGCVDKSDQCGGCAPCSPGKVCENGVCVCQDGLTLCGETCLDLARDERNCGFCGHRCDVVDPNRPDCCAGECVNKRFHPHRCGQCNNRCQINESCIAGECRCTQECCNGNDSGVCTGPRFCCPEPCSRCVGEECLRWRDGIVGGYCEERLGECQVVQQYCPFHPVVYDCCGDNETCTATGCERA